MKEIGFQDLCIKYKKKSKELLQYAQVTTKSSALEDFLICDNLNLRHSVLSNDSLSNEFLESFIKKTTLIIKRMLARQIIKQTLILDILSNDKDSTTRMNVASNANTSFSTLKRMLMNDLNTNVKQYVVYCSGTV